LLQQDKVYIFLTLM